VEFFPATRQCDLGVASADHLRGGVEVAERGDLGCNGPPRSVQVQGVGSQDDFDLRVSVPHVSVNMIA